MKPEAKLSIFFIATSAVFAFIGTTLGGLLLANLSGVPVTFGLGLFPAHPFIQVFGFLGQFVMGVAYSLLPLFGGNHLRRLWPGYVSYALTTAADLIFLFMPVVSTHVADVAVPAASSLLLAGTLVFALQVAGIASGSRTEQLEPRLFQLLSAASLVLTSLVLLLETSDPSREVFGPELLYIGLMGFAGSMIYGVELKTTSFRWSNYKKGAARLSFCLQASGVVTAFLSFFLPYYPLLAATRMLFLLAAIVLLFSLRLLERGHHYLYTPTMSGVHSEIVRYNEACLRVASGWLVLGLAFGVVWQVTGVAAFAVRDSFIHSLAMGFVGSTVVCYAPMLLPGVLGRKSPVGGLNLWPVALLTAATVVRIAGNIYGVFTTSLPIWESLTGPLTIASMTWFLVVVHRIETGIPKRNSTSIRQREPKDDLKSLSSLAELTLSVKGRKTGRTIVVPVWFVMKGNTIYVAPMKGSATNWYRNLKKDPAVMVHLGDLNFAGAARDIVDRGELDIIISLFKMKIGEKTLQEFFGSSIECALGIDFREQHGGSARDRSLVGATATGLSRGPQPEGLSFPRRNLMLPCE